MESGLMGAVFGVRDEYSSTDWLLNHVNILNTTDCALKMVKMVNVCYLLFTTMF